MTANYILTHGLNMRPSAMRRLAKALDLPSKRCTFVELPGHRPGESLRHITASQWLDSFGEQYQAATSTYGKAEVVHLGYSLGGLLMTHALGKGRIAPPTKQILFAPALAFRPWTRIPTLFPTSVMDQLLIPSFSPKRYKATPGVTIGAYKAMFEISADLENVTPMKYNVPTLVLCDQRDEMVNPEGLRTFIRKKNLSQWKAHVLPSSLWERWGKKHLVVAREYQSDAYWSYIKNQVDDFLKY